VTPAWLGVTADNQTRAYGASNPPLTFTFSGFLNGDTTNVIAGQPTLSTVAATNSVVGAYPIAISNGTLSALNYTFSPTYGQLTVTQAVLTVSADHQSRQYGQTNPTLTVSYSGFVNDEDTNVLSGSPDLSTAAVLGSPAGTYAIVVTNGTLSATNYSFAFTNGTLSVGLATLYVHADDQSRVYGATNPTLTVHYNGFRDGDDSSVLTGNPNVSTAAATNSQVGNYGIFASLGTLASSNYDFLF
jgi:hypothetical protein